MDLLQGIQRRWIERHFTENEIPFVVIGGVAVKFYCPERETADVDLFVGGDPDQIKRLILAVPALSKTPHVEGKLLDYRTGFFRIEGVHKIDILTFAPALEFTESLQTAEAYQEDNISFPMLSRDLLIRHKQAVCEQGDGDQKDLDDIELLQAPYGTGA